jgi:hypothetical protein
MTEDYQNLGTLTYTPPERRELLAAVRTVLTDNPERHAQDGWSGNVFDDNLPLCETILLGELRPLAGAPVPDEPQDEDHPVCGTTGCCAGWAVFLGDDPRAKLQEGYMVILPDGTFSTVRERARKLLGLSDAQANWLFASERTREEIIAALDRLAEDPDAAIWDSSLVTYEVEVFDEHGMLVYLHAADVNSTDPEDVMVAGALREAFDTFTEHA